MVWFLGMEKGDGVPVGQYGVGGWRGWLLSMLWFTKNVYLSEYKSNISFCCFTLSLTSRSRRWLNWRRWGWCRTMRYKQKQIVIFSFKYKMFIISVKLLSLRNLLLTKNCFPQIILWKRTWLHTSCSVGLPSVVSPSTLSISISILGKVALLITKKVLIQNFELQNIERVKLNVRRRKMLHVVPSSSMV